MIRQEQLQATRIVLVDDDVVNRHGLKKVLHTHGFHDVLSLLPNDDLGARLHDSFPGLIILNLALNSANALDVLKTLSTQLDAAPAPLLVLAEANQADYTEQALALGAKDYVSVPINERLFVNRVLLLLEHSFLGQKNTSNIVNTAATERDAGSVARHGRDTILAPVTEQKDLMGSVNSDQSFRQLGEALQQLSCSQRSLAVLLFSFENFGEICKTLGAESADSILSMALQRLSDTVSKISMEMAIEDAQSHVVTRFYGGKFIIVLHDLNTEEKAVLIAHRILSSMAYAYELPGLALEITAQIGISIAPRHGKESDNLFRQAEVALFKAKQTSRPVVVYSSDIDHYDATRLALIPDLRKAINTNQLSLVYQPKINIKTGNVCGVEALLRWVHPEHGFIGPNEFIPLAEQNSVIKPLTIWVMNTAMRQSVEFYNASMDIPVAINISATCLRDDAIVGYAKMLLEKTRIAPDRLIMEITESAMMQDPALGLNLLNQLNEMGVQISIDDYGTGYSSLAYLKRLPVNEMKIDRAFIKDMANDEDDKLIVSTTIEMGHKFGLRVTAEGVEDNQTVALLKTMNCDQVQGYYYAKPMPRGELYDWMEQQKQAV